VRTIHDNARVRTPPPKEAQHSLATRSCLYKPTIVLSPPLPKNILTHTPYVRSTTRNTPQPHTSTGHHVAMCVWGVVGTGSEVCCPSCGNAGMGSCGRSGDSERGVLRPCTNLHQELCPRHVARQDGGHQPVDKEPVARKQAALIPEQAQTLLHPRLHVTLTGKDLKGG
jgi:hypothetical protein